MRGHNVRDMVSHYSWHFARHEQILFSHRLMTDCYLQPCTHSANECTMFSFCHPIDLKKNEHSEMSNSWKPVVLPHLKNKYWYFWILHVFEAGRTS